jgi:hypothetical protein
VELLDFEYYGAAQWLKAAEGLFDINTRPWLRDLVDYYRDWTIVANGAGIDKDEQIEGEPDSWNEIYFKLAARCLSGLSPEQAGSVMPIYFDQLPDESLFDNLKIFLGESDELFFNQKSISSEMAVSIRTLAANLLRFTRGWRRLQYDRTLSSPRNISAVVSKFYFNSDGGGLVPSTCYLLPVAIPRMTPFLTVFEDLALDCRCPLIGLVALNLIEVAPSAAHKERETGSAAMPHFPLGYRAQSSPLFHQCTNDPATRKTCPPEVLKARPFCPQRTSRPMLPLTLLMVVESTSASVVRLKDCNVTVAEPNDCVRK